LRIKTREEAALSAKREKLLAVPTNIITGFLGVGKTTAIMHLLSQKPAEERWAVLINEFGEIGVDGSIVQGQSGTNSGIHIKEVPGGCMCCAAGLPMQIALSLLLQQAKPQRLLIEPTGLGHPVEVMQALAAKHYRDVLKLQRTLTLLDARKLSEKRYTTHPTFNQQLEIADVIVANKADLYADEDRAALDEFINQHPNPKVELQITSLGEIDLNCLQGNPTAVYDAATAHTQNSDITLAGDLPLPDNGRISAENSGEGFFSKGWRFSPNQLFDRKRLLIFLTALKAERMKAVFITSSGIFAYNLTRDALTEIAIDDCMESRIEIIADLIDPAWEQELMDCFNGVQ
jgi:G3E family GTPase